MLARDDTHLDLNYVHDGKTASSESIYLKGELAKEARSIELPLSAQVIEVDTR